MKYRICPYCGAHLDFGEKCECREERKTKRENEEKAPFTGTPVQLVIFTDWPKKSRETA